MADVLFDKLNNADEFRKKRAVVGQMYNERSRYESVWKDLSRYIFPEHGRFGEENGGREGKRRDGYLINPYPINAVKKCAAGLHSGLTSPSRPWFKLGLQDKEKAEFHSVRQWLDECEEVMRSIYARGNTYQMLFNIDAELPQFGTAAALMLEDFDFGLWHRAFTCGEYAGAVDARGRVVKFARRFSMPAYMMVKEFGRERLSQMVLNAYERQDVQSRFSVEMLIEENDGFDASVPFGFGNFPWRSYYWEAGGNNGFLKVSGYCEQPFIMPRWETVANEVYGVGCGHSALGDCMQLQKLERNKLRAVDNECDPPMVMPASLRGVDRNAGGNNYVPDGLQVQAYRLVPPGRENYAGILELIREKQDLIGAAFYNDLFIMLGSVDNPQMTAREVAERHEEKLLLLGPVLEQMHNEVLEPLTMRCFGICKRNGLLPPQPEEVGDGELKVSFISLLAQAQEMIALPALERTVQFATALANANPEVLDVVDFDAVVRKHAVINGTPEELLRSEQEVEDLRKARAEQQAAQAQQEQLMAMAQPAKDLSQAAKNAKDAGVTDEQSLDSMVTGGGGEGIF